jgi:hypothetical protein
MAKQLTHEELATVRARSTTIEHVKQSNRTAYKSRGTTVIMLKRYELFSASSHGSSIQEDGGCRQESREG